jgi:hypothetical protein
MPRTPVLTYFALPIPFLVGVEMMGWEGRRTYMDTNSHQVAKATN